MDQNPIDILLDIVIEQAKIQNIEVDIKSFDRAKEMIILSCPPSSEMKRIAVAFREMNDLLPTAQEAAERLGAEFKVIKLREPPVIEIPVFSMEKDSKKRKAWISPYNIGKRNH